MKNVAWKKKAKKQLKAAYDYIYERSPQNADSVLDEIIETIQAVAKHPTTFPLDTYRPNQKGNLRFFIIHRYRIHYKVLENEGISIESIVHTKRNE
jgi:toxin ParE1/3/4